MAGRAGRALPRGTIVRNKANSSIADFGLAIADCAEQSQFAAMPQGRGTADEGRLCETKPILREADWRLSSCETMDYERTRGRCGDGKQSQFGEKKAAGDKRQAGDESCRTKPIPTYRVDPMDPESAGVRRSPPEVPCLLCGVEFSVSWGYDLWDAFWLPSSGRKEGLCFLAGPGKGWIQDFTWTIDWQQPHERGGPLRRQQ